MDYPGLERFYERLAVAIDEAGPVDATRFLAKLALMLAHRLDDPDQALAAIEACLKDLE